MFFLYTFWFISDGFFKYIIYFQYNKILVKNQIFASIDWNIELTNFFFLIFSRVLKPPGGGSSDIFGAGVPNTPRSARNHQVSNIFNAPSADAKNGNGKWKLESNIQLLPQKSIKCHFREIKIQQNNSKPEKKKQKTNQEYLLFTYHISSFFLF